jgi:hypothetical protein
MTVGAGISVADGNLVVLGSTVLHDVHENIMVTAATGGALVNGGFIGVRSAQNGSRRVFPIGKLEYVSISHCIYIFFSFLKWMCFYLILCLCAQKMTREWKWDYDCFDFWL